MGGLDGDNDPWQKYRDRHPRRDGRGEQRARESTDTRDDRRRRDDYKRNGRDRESRDNRFHRANFARTPSPAVQTATLARVAVPTETIEKMIQTFVRNIFRASVRNKYKKRKTQVKLWEQNPRCPSEKPGIKVLRCLNSSAWEL